MGCRVQMGVIGLGREGVGRYSENVKKICD